MAALAFAYMGKLKARAQITNAEIDVSMELEHIVVNCAEGKGYVRMWVR